MGLPIWIIKVPDHYHGPMSFRKPTNPDSHRSFDDSVYAAMREAAQCAIERGIGEERIGALLGDALAEALRELSPKIADAIVETSPKMMRWHRSRVDRFHRNLMRRWRKGLDLFYCVLNGAEELGADYNERARAAIEKESDTTSEVLTGIHARACRVGHEVHHLLSGGYPMGALARCRTLHELAVTAILISDFGRKPEHQDLARRFLDHTAVLVYRDAQTYQESCATLGYEPYSDAEIARMKEERDAALELYGVDFKRDYGWAAKLHPNPNFRELQKLAKLSHLRAHYQWASHEVHSDPKGWALNIYSRGAVSYMSTGSVNTGLVDPAHLALISLHQCTVATVTNSSDLVSLRDLVGLAAMQILVDRAGVELLESQQAVDESEERIQRRAESRVWRRLYRLPIVGSRLLRG